MAQCFELSLIWIFQCIFLSKYFSFNIYILDTGETEQEDIDLIPNITITTGQGQTVPRTAGQAQGQGVRGRTDGQVAGGHQHDMDNLADDEDMLFQENNY